MWRALISVDVFIIFIWNWNIKRNKIIKNYDGFGLLGDWGRRGRWCERKWVWWSVAMKLMILLLIFIAFAFNCKIPLWK
jgi:hypothetical protein